MASERQFYDGHLINYSSSNGYPTIFVDGRNVLLHRYVWMQCHGKIPEGFQIHHKDKNRLNYSIDNLELIKASDHARHHAVETGLGVSNKGKMKRHDSGFCKGATAVCLWKNDSQIYFESVSEAAKFLKVKEVGNVSRVLTNKRKTIKGWCCRYA